MLHQLVNHNEDIRKLVEHGYSVAFDNNYLVLRDIPYLDSEHRLQSGAIVTKLVFKDEFHVEQEDHQVFFAGSVPYEMQDGQIRNLGGGETHLTLSEACSDVVVQRSFSNKPAVGKFQDFFEKIESYVAIISGPAIEMYKVTPYTFLMVKKSAADPDPIFRFPDTLSSRAEIIDLGMKLQDDIIAVIGLGGTGSYLLDFLVKTPVREIRAFDNDPFYIHNAFRSPGKLSPREFRKPKSEVYKGRYKNFRDGLSFFPKSIDATCNSDLNGVTFAFVCVDKGSSRSGIFDLLISKNIPFIDVGMGLVRKEGVLNGLVRTTYFPAHRAQEVRDKKVVEESDNRDDIYKSNIQISELNALNACMAVIKYKQIRGFYFEEVPFYNLAYEIGDMKIVGEDNIDEI